jgi:hypothetical protein
METQIALVLRPLRLGELLDQAIRLYRRNFITFIGIIAVIYIPLMILQTASTALLTSSIGGLATASRPEEIFTNYAYWGGLLSTFIITFIQFILVQGIATGALTRAVADNYLGRQTGILDAYRGIGKSWTSLLGALLFVGLLAFVIFLWWLIVPCIGWFTGLGMLTFLMAAVSPLVAPVVVLERTGPWSTPTDTIIERTGKFITRTFGSIRRAWDLARRRFWPVLGTIFVLYLFSLLIVNGPAAIVNAILTQVITSFGDVTTQLVITTIVQSLVSLVFVLLYYPLQMAAFTLIYFDLRVRTEGFDIALLTMNASEPVDVANVSQVPVPQSNERLITGPELGNFAILTLGAIGLYVLFFSLITAAAFFFASFFIR